MMLNLNETASELTFSDKPNKMVQPLKAKASHMAADLCRSAFVSFCAPFKAI